MNYTADHYRTRATGKALELLANQEDWITRFELVKGFSSSIRSSEYHLTNACNIRCKGCWFFEYGHDKGAREKTDIADWRDFIKRESERGVNSALLIGGEPTLFEERIAVLKIIYQKKLFGLHQMAVCLIFLLKQCFCRYGIVITRNHLKWTFG